MRKTGKSATSFDRRWKDARENAKKCHILRPEVEGCEGEQEKKGDWSRRKAEGRMVEGGRREEDGGRRGKTGGRREETKKSGRKVNLGRSIIK